MVLHLPLFCVCYDYNFRKGKANKFEFVDGFMKARLGDYIREYSVRNKINEDIPVYSVTNSQGFCKDYFGKEVASKDKSTYKIVPKGCFAYNPSRINVGSVDWQRNEERVIVSPLYNVFSVSSDLDNQYLYYFLKSDIALCLIKNIATGSVRDNLKLSMLYEFPINLPNIERQKEIVSTLDKLQSIITHLRTQLEKLDLLVKARFVEMFGNPIANSMNWAQPELKECLESIDNGKSYICNTDSRVDNSPAILKLSAVTYGIYKPNENKSMINKELFDKNIEVKDCDLLFTRKNTPELVGMSAYVFSTPQKLMMPDLIFRINTKTMCNKIYLWQLINHDLFRPCIQNIANGSAKSMSNISKERLSHLTIPLPPIELQTQFADFVKQVDQSKSILQQELDKAQMLFDSLMQEYFG